MPTGTVSTPTISGLGSRRFVLPVSIVSDWVDLCTDPATIDNESGVMTSGVVTNPGAITRTAQNWLDLAGVGTLVQVRLKYPTASSGVSGPVVQVFGRDRQKRAQRLVDGLGGHQITLAVDTANDIRDGQFSYTQPTDFDAQGCAEVLAAVRTALSGTGISGATIQARAK
jgi:hypothetical protein